MTKREKELFKWLVAVADTFNVYHHPFNKTGLETLEEARKIAKKLWEEK